jgi:hypothetical protein
MKNRAVFLRLPLIAGIGAVALLASCGTPQERCIREATRDMAVVDQLIAETEGNLQRGFALQRETIYRTEFEDCTPPATASDPTPRGRMCPVQVPDTVTRPVAINLADESAKLASLQAKRTQQGTVAAAAMAQCRALYPE